MPYPSQREVAEIVAIADPVVRNVAITACYRDLALAVAEIVGRIDVNWLAFGAYTSTDARLLGDSGGHCGFYATHG